jgi:WD40 repeat protein
VAAAWSPDGTQLATVNSSYAVQIWDVEAGKVAVPVTGSATNLVWHPQNKLICGYSTQFSVFDPATKKISLTVETAMLQPPYWTAGRPLVTGLMTPKLALWDGTTGKHLRDLSGHTAAVAAVSWSRDGKRLASASHDTTVRVWDSAKGEIRHKLEGHTAAVTTVSWSPNGKWLASAGNDKSVRLWDPEDGTGHPLESHTSAVRALNWSPMSNQLLSGGADTKVIVWDPNTRKAVRTIAVHEPVLSLACAMFNKTLTLACGTTDEQLQILDVTTGQVLSRLCHGGSPPSVTSLAWLPQGGYLFAGRGCHTAQVWDVGSNKVGLNLQAMAAVAYVTIAGNGSVLVAGSHDGAVRFWDAASGQLYAAVLDCGSHPVLLTSDGNYREERPDGSQSERPAGRQTTPRSGKTPAGGDQDSALVFVALTPEGQHTLTGDEFAARFHWRNNPARVKLVPGR